MEEQELYIEAVFVFEATWEKSSSIEGGIESKIYYI